MKIRKPPKRGRLWHPDHGYVQDLGSAPDSYKTPSWVIKLKSGLIVRVPKDELEEK